MHAHQRSLYDTPSSASFNQVVEDPKQPYGDGDFNNYNYPPAQRHPYPMSVHSKAVYSDSDGATEEQDFSSSRRGLRAPRSVESDTRPWIQRLLPSSTAARLYLLVVVLQTAIDMALEADILVQFQDLPSTDRSAQSNVNFRRLPVYLGIFALAHVFQFILAIDAVVFRNTLQFAFLVIFNGLVLLYSAIQVSEVRSIFPPNQKGVFSKIPITALTTAIPIAIAVAEVAYIALGWKIYTEFGWQLYKLLGADRRIKKMYAQYQVLECMLKFDVFFWLGFSVQFIGFVLINNKADFEFGLTIAALPLSMLLLIEGHLAAKHENRWMMGSFLVGMVAGFAYFTYKLYKIIIGRDTKEIKPVFGSLAIFTAIAMLLLVTTFTWACIVMMNFNRGLKEQIAKSKNGKNSRRDTRHPGGFSMSSHPNRMSIE